MSFTAAQIDDLPGLEAIDAECDRYFAFDPPCEQNHSCPLRECITTGDIPPGVKREDFRREHYVFNCIRQDGITIGYLAYYLEYQRKDTVYLSVMCIREANRGGGIGAEVLSMLTAQLAGRFRIIRLHCSLRNAMALRFWVKQGFDHIVAVEGNGNLYPGNFAGIELQKNID